MTTNCPPIPVPDGLCSPSDRFAGRCPDAIRNWFRVENAATDGMQPVDIVIDGPIVDPFMADFLGIGVSSTQVVEAILSLRGHPLTVWINSEGGLITAGLAIYGQLRMHDAPVTTVVYGAAMSIASLIAMAGSTVIMAPASFLFIHEARNEVDGTASDHRTQADLLDQLSDQIAGVYASRGGTKTDWRALMKAGTGDMQGTLITAEDAVKRKLADRIDTSIVRQAVNLVDLQPYRVRGMAAEAVNLADSGAMQGLAAALNEAVAVHHTDTTDAAWDDAAARKNARSGEDESYYRDIFAWQDPDKDAATKDAWSFTHHMVDADGTPGAANVTACSSAIGVLNGARMEPGDDMPWMADREGIWEHLAAHLSDANADDPNYEPPPLEDASEIDAENTLTIRAAQRALEAQGFSNRRAKAILAKGWTASSGMDEEPTSGMDEEPEAEETTPPTDPVLVAAAQALARSREWEALYVPMLGLNAMQTKE